VIRSAALLRLALALGCSSLWGGAAEQTATVEIVPLTITGELVENGRVDLMQQGTKKSFRANFRGWRGTNIPYGEYVLRIEAPGFRSHEQNLRVYQPVVPVRVGLRVTLTDDEARRDVQGRVTSVDTGRGELWVKLVPVLANGPSMDARVLNDGRFTFAGIDPGEYLLIVIRGTSVIHTQQAKLFGGESIEIPLTAEKPAH
jgi:hypothetical protein